MKHHFNKRFLIALATALVVAAGGTIVHAGIPDSSNVYHACVLNGVGTIRLIDPSLPATSVLSHCISGKETAIPWNQQGPPGQPGVAGVDGKNGTNGVDGTSVASSTLAVGDAHCPNGGAQFVSVSGTTYACNGANGLSGKDGQDGAPGTSLSSISQLNGLSCAIGGGQGTVTVDVAPDGTITARCVPNAPGGGTTPCASTDVASAIKINEVGVVNSSPFQSFIELYNGCSGSIDISGWSLVYRQADNNSDPTFGDLNLLTFVQGTVIQANRFLAAGDIACFSAARCRLLISQSLAIDGAAIGLRTPAGQLVDSVAYGTLSAPNNLTEGRPAPNIAISIGRSPDGSDTNDNSADFRQLSYASPGFMNAAPAPNP